MFQLKIYMIELFRLEQMTLPDLSSVESRRRKLGLSQAQLASVSGVSRSSISKVELAYRGRRPGRRPAYVPNYEDAKRLLEELEKEEAQRSKGMTSEKIGKIAHSPVNSVSPEDKVKAAWRLMKELDYSQLPVIKNDSCVGRITEGAILTAIEELGSLERVYDSSVRSIMEDPLPLLGPDIVLASVMPLLKEEKAILVSVGGKIGGILTAYDVIA